jgi:SAM-dependent methyltransferase
MLYLDKLGLAYRENTQAMYGFCFGDKNLASISAAKLILLGTGRNSALCTLLLERAGLEVYAYCDNNPDTWGKPFLSKRVLSPYVAFEDRQEDYYFITTSVLPPFLMNAQLTANDIQEHSHFLIHSFAEFNQAEETQLLENALNLVINRHFSHSDITSICNNPLNWHEFAGVDFLLRSPEWWNCIYMWLFEKLYDSSGAIAILEIGPGYGLLSSALFEMCHNISIEWIDKPQKNHYMKSYSKDSISETIYLDATKNKYPVLVHKYNIESPEIKIDKKYDIIVMTEVFEHFRTNPLPIMKKIKSLLSRDGTIYLSTPNWGHLPIYKTWKDMKEYGDIKNEKIDLLDRYDFEHSYQYSEDELREIFGTCGLSVLKYSISISNNHNFILKHV